jgi:hypothetical protein
MPEVRLTLRGATAAGAGAGSIGLRDSKRILSAGTIDALSHSNKAPVGRTVRATLVSHDVRIRRHESRFGLVATLRVLWVAQAPA